LFLTALLEGPTLVASQSSLAGFDDCLGAVSHLDFIEDVGDVIADGFAADVQLLSDLLVTQSLGDEAQDIALTLG
jgi:hypothetical protein